MTYNYNTSTLLTSNNNPKTSPDLNLGYLVGTLYLAPQKNIINAPHYGIQYDPKAINLAKVNLCKNATTGCATACIYHQGIFKHALFQKNKVKQARLKRTLKFLTQREAFFEQLVKEIKALQRKAKRRDLTLSLCLNGTSDILWEKESFIHKDKEYKNIMEFFSEVNFFDYTKYNIIKSRKKLPKNYHLTYSRAGTKKGQTVDDWNVLCEYLDKNINVAIVCTQNIKEKLLENETYNNYKIIDGNSYNNRVKDLELKEDKGLIILLEANKKTDLNSSGFIIQTPEEVSLYLS